MLSTHTPWTLHELDPQPNGERRWSIVSTGPIAYLTCDEDVAALLAAAQVSHDTLIAALPYVETAQHDEAYKKGVVAKMVKQMRTAISAVEPKERKKS